MTKREKNKLGVIHEVKKVEIEHNQEKDTFFATHGTNHYKRGYMAHKHNKKLGHCSECENQSVSQEEFDRMLMVALNTPPRKRTKKDRNKL
jgi:hypothetical protein